MVVENTQDQRTVEARAAFTASLNSVGSQLDSELQSRVKDIHANSAVIAKQETEVAKQTALLAKQSARYQQIADESREKLKEIGDVQNWAELIERDLLVLEETMRIVEEEQQEEVEEDKHGRRKWKGWF
ncbi:hypothetical protein MMC14_000627 [Varicellaria rhodocarpa]|nr:hypothetical protein [Varicellaria rhodocarpa]